MDKGLSFMMSALKENVKWVLPRNIIAQILMSNELQMWLFSGEGIRFSIFGTTNYETQHVVFCLVA